MLTNLQRGNVRTEEIVPVPQKLSWHISAAMGEITMPDIIDAARNGA